MTPEVFDIFPTPIARYERLLDTELIAELVEYFDRQARIENVNSANLSHTQMLAPEKHSSFQRLSQLVETPLVEFGKLIFGETLHWSIKEMWVNHLEHGGRQSLHNHANSFVSGVIYLTESDPSANTVFAKSPGGHEFVFNNTNARAALGPYNAGKWVSPDPAPGDMILFPSYLLHEVPTNKGNRRVSMAFNAIPDRLDSWGYTLTLAR